METSTVRINGAARTSLKPGFLIEASASLGDIAPYMYVRRTFEFSGGYQRNLRPKDVEGFAKFLEEVPVVPGAIVLCTSPGIVATYNRPSKVLELPRREQALEVVDGQHRFFGAMLYLERNPKKTMRAQIQLFCGMDDGFGARMFGAINGSMKKAHVGYLGLAEIEAGTLDGWQREAGELYRVVMDGLAFDGKQGVHPRQFYQALRPAYEGVLKNATIDKRASVVTSYIRMVRDLVGDEVMRRPAFFIEIMRILPNVMDRAKARHKTADAAAMRRVLEPLKNANPFANGRKRELVAEELRASVLPVELADGDY